MEMKKFYTIGNESFSYNQRFESLDDCKFFLKEDVSFEEKQDLFGLKHTPLIVKHLYNKVKNIMEMKSYTPFLCGKYGLVFLETKKSGFEAVCNLSELKLIEEKF